VIEVMSMREEGVKKLVFPQAVVIDRSSNYGNPFKISDRLNRDMVVGKYKIWVWEKYYNETQFMYHFDNDLVYNKDLKYLLCWCAPLLCHGDVLIKMINYLRSVR
jgi:hypothetical protein